MVARRLGADIGDADLKRSLAGADVLVHLAAGPTHRSSRPGGCSRPPSDAAVARLVVVSSALVYGAWPTNPVPLTDDAALRPNPDFLPAVALGEVERLVGEWADAHPSATVAVLRPARARRRGRPRAGWRDMLASVRGVPVGEDDPPCQFVHLDDVAVGGGGRRRARLDGAANVAPDGWISRRGAPRPSPAGPGPRSRSTSAERLTSWRWRAGISPTPPGILPVDRAPVGGGRRPAALAGLGGRRTSNEEAFVAGHKAAAVGHGVAAAPAGAHAGHLGRRHRRRRRRRRSPLVRRARRQS